VLFVYHCCMVLLLTSPFRSELPIHCNPIYFHSSCLSIVSLRYSPHNLADICSPVLTLLRSLPPLFPFLPITHRYRPHHPYYPPPPPAGESVAATTLPRKPVPPPEAIRRARQSGGRGSFEAAQRQRAALVWTRVDAGPFASCGPW
jgi:hypothetical protein